VVWRKRKRMELVRFADRRRQRVDDRSPDELYLTRRMFVLKGLVVAGFAGLATKLWKMQVIDAGIYEGRAEGNIIKDEPIPAPRGMILDRAGRVLAENRVVWQVHVTPAQLPRDRDAYRYVRDQLIHLLGFKEMLVLRRNGIPEGSEDAVMEKLAVELAVDVEEIRSRVDATHETQNVISIRRDLEPAEADQLRDLERRLPGVAVVNYFDYVVEAHSWWPTPVLLKKDVDRGIALALEANKLYLPGIAVDGSTLIRRYRGGPEFSHLLGYVGPITEQEYEATRSATGQSPYLRTDYVGRGGLEEAMETQLRGRRGIRWVQTDARGVVLGEIEQRRLDARPGRNLHLTIDLEFQRAVKRALQEGIDLANEEALDEDKDPVGSGVVVAMDPRNGEILAMVSLPDYDNQHFVDGISQAQYDEYINNPYKPLTNFAVSGAFPPGSTLKPLLGCMGLQEGTITPGTQYRCVGSIEVPTIGYSEASNTYVCWNRHGHGVVALEEAIAESCNIYFYNVGAPRQTPEGATEPLHYFNPGDAQPHYFEGLGIDRIERYLKDEFHFGAPTGIELASEAPGVVPNPQWLFHSALREYWSVGDTINVSIGQGHLACTPLQLTCAMAAIAHGGIYYRPRLVRATEIGNGGAIDEAEPDIVRELSFDREHVETIRHGMLRTVTEGTAWDKFPRTGDDIPIGGKTGTADYGEAVDGRYRKQHAWFSAFAPYDEPEIVVTVLIAGGGEGSTYAVPVADAVLAAYFGREPLEPVEADDSDESDELEGDEVEDSGPADEGDADDAEG
jgi:penicillin-binding protein 2